MPYTIYDIETEKIVGRWRVITRLGVPDGCDWIEGDVDDVRFRIDRETGVPYPFIDQSQLPWLIRAKSKSLLASIGMMDGDVARWSAQKAAIDTLNLDSVTWDGSTYTRDAFLEMFRSKLIERQRILDVAARLTAMDPIPQDAEDDRHWIE